MGKASQWTGNVAAAVLMLGAIGAAQEPATLVVIPPARLDVMPGDPLSTRALVTKPLPITGVVSWTLETRRHRGTFWCQALSPDGQTLATGGLDGTVRIWDVETGRLVRALIGHNSYVYHLDWSPDGQTIASAGSFDATVRLWDVKTGRPLRVLRGHPAYISQVKWSPDGRRVLASGGESGALSHWSAISGKKEGTVELGRVPLSLSWRPDGRVAAVVCYEVALQLWDAEKNKVLRTIGKASDNYLSAGWSPDGKILAAGTAKNTFLFDGETGTLLHTLQGAASVVAWSHDAKLLFTMSDSIKVWDPAKAVLLKTLPTPGARSFSANRDGTLFISGNGTALTSHDGATVKPLRSFDIAGSVSPWWWSGKPLVTGVGTPKLSLWDPAAGKLLRSLEGHSSSISAVAFAPDGKSLATASYDQTVRVWETGTGNPLQQFKSHSAYVLAVAFAANGKLLASAGSDQEILVWDVKTGKVQQRLKGHAADVTALAWAPGSSTTLASAARERNVRIWNISTGKTAKILEATTDVVSLAWSPSGTQLAGGQADMRLHIWQVASGKPLLTLSEGGSPPQVSALAWSPNGQILAAGRGNHTMQLWNATNGKKNFSLQTMAPVQRLAWVPGGSTIVASNDDRTTRFFDAASGQLRGVLLAEDKQIMAVHFDGHFRAPDPEADLVYVLQTFKSQDTYTPSQFAAKFKLKNSPAKVKLTGK